MAELNERDAKVVQWLNEAHAKEAELEADLTAHIALTQKPTYKKRLQQHLKETRDHKRRVAQRIRKLGGAPTTGPNVPGVPGAFGEVAGKAVAAVKGQVGAARAVITEQAETHLRNAQEELREEHVEIAIYTRIETLATAVGDRETAQLAKAIRRDEERMAKFLDAELKRLVKAVVKADIPAAQRNGSKPASRRRRTAAASSNGRATTRSKPSSSSSRKTAASSRKTAASSRKTAASSRKPASSSRKPASSSRKPAASSRKTAASSRSRSGGRARTTARSS